MTDSRPTRKPTPEQLRARRELADARQKTLDRKRRTRQLIQTGGVLASFGIDTPEQAERLMSALLDPKRAGWRRFLADELKARPTDRWPPA